MSPQIRLALDMLLAAAQVAAGTWALLCLATLLVTVAWCGMCWVTARRPRPATPDAGLTVLDQPVTGDGHTGSAVDVYAEDLTPAPYAALAADGPDQPIDLDEVLRALETRHCLMPGCGATDREIYRAYADITAPYRPPVIPGREDQP